MFYNSQLLDIGKYSEEFQKRINDPEHTRKVDHSTAGAIEARKMKNTFAAMAIAGHHSGLLDGGSPKMSEESDGTFFGRLKKQIPDYGRWSDEITVKEAPLPDFCLVN